jgi:hypothetical protein
LPTVIGIGVRYGRFLSTYFFRVSDGVEHLFHSYLAVASLRMPFEVTIVVFVYRD